MSQQMCMPKHKTIKAKTLLTKTEVSNLVKDIYVGYNPSNTLETAIASASKVMMNQLKISLTHQEVMDLTSGLNVISAGGLDNFFYQMYQKLATSNQKLVA